MKMTKYSKSDDKQQQLQQRMSRVLLALQSVLHYLYNLNDSGTAQHRVMDVKLLSANNSHCHNKTTMCDFCINATNVGLLILFKTVNITAASLC